jgi:hypothetical protein
MRKLIIVLTLILVIAAPSYAMNIIDKILCKQVVLRNNNGVIVLVNRLTGQVESVMSNGQSVPLTKELKKQFQAVYNAQERSY